jgi:hypothetical protein
MGNRRLTLPEITPRPRTAPRRDLTDINDGGSPMRQEKAAEEEWPVDPKWRF